MKVKMIFLVLVLFIGVLWADGSGNGTSTVNLFDRVRNCPAVSTEREGNSNSIYVSTFGLSPSYADTIRGIPGSLHKIDILNGLLTVIFNFESIEFDEDYDHLHAYDAYDQDFIETDSVVCDEAQYRIGGQNGFWSSPVLNEEHNLLYLLTKAGMLFTVDIEQMEVTGNYYNLRAVEKGNPNQNLEINRYEYLATPLLCRETSGDYLIIPGIWHTFKITLSDGLLYSYNLINDISLPLLGEDRFIASAAMDYESPPNLVVISKEGRLFRKKGATVYSNYLPDNPTQCYFQPVINEDGHFYINTEDSVYRIPVDGRISVGAWANDFEIELVADITDLENIEVSGMGKEIIVTRNVDDYNQLIPEYDTYISTGLEDIINHSNELYYQGNLVNAYRLMNNHSIYIQKEQESNCLFSLNNYTYSQDPPFSNENYYVGEIPSVSRLYWEFIKPPDIPNQCSCGYFQYQNWNHLSYATPVLYYTVENRVNVLVFDEQGCVGTWIRSPSESQLGFSPLYYNGEEYYPLYPEQGYSKFMDTPPNVIEFSTIDSINIHYLCEQETDYSIYLNSYAREAVIDTFATANFERLMKHPKYTLSVFDGDTLVYRNDNFRLLDENIHDYYIIGDDTLNVTVGMDTTITNPGGDPNGVIVFNTINVFRGGILRIAGNANVQTTNLNIEEGGLLETTGTMAAEELKLLEVPGCNQPAKILASGYVYADIMEMEDEVEAEFTGYGGNASYDHNINVNNLRDTGYELNSILTVSHTNSAYSDHDVYIAGDKARFSLIVDGDLKTGNLDLFTSGYNIHTTAGNDVQMQITGSGSLCSIGSSLFRRDIEIVKGGLWENESGRIRISNNTDSLFTIHNYGRIDLQDDVYLTGNYYDSENDTTYTGGYKLYLYEDSEMYLRGAEICIGADEVYYPNYDGGKVIQEGRAVIQLEDSGFLHITSIDTLGAGHTPTGGILKIDASSDKHAKIGGEEVATALQDGDRILIEKKGEINGNIGLYPRRVSYLDVIRLDVSSAYWQGVEFNSTIDDAIDDDHFEFSNCIFTNLKSFSICSLDSIEVNFANCSFEDNYRSLYITYRKEINGAVVETSNNVNATITECTFYDNYNGILIESGSGPENLNYLQVNSSDFGKLDGQTASGGNSIGIMAIGEESETTVKGCNFYDNDYGIFANKTLCQVGDDHDGNNFQYNEKPLYMSTMDDTVSIITYNTISNNETNGIYCYLGDFGINNNTISVNEGHGVVAISSVIRRYNFNDNDINNNGSIEIYASAENMRQLENGGNIIEDDSYVIPPSVIPLSIWKYYSDFDRYILAAEYADSLMNVFGNTIPDSTDSLRFYPSDTLYVFTESRNSSYNAGIAAYNNGEYNTAVAELSEYISENPYINRSHSALPYLYFAERRTSGNMAGYRQFSDTSLPYTTADTLMYWQMKLLYADSYLADHDYSEAIESYQEILENEPSYDDSLQAAIMQGYAYLKFTQEGERNSNIECLIQTSTLEDYCDYLLHCTDEETGNEEVIPVISRVFNYPNPFNPDTKICFQLREPSERVTVTVYNIKGQKVWEYTEYDLERGKQEVVWTGVNRSGRQVASGVYLYRIKADGCKRASKMLLLK